MVFNHYPAESEFILFRNQCRSRSALINLTWSLTIILLNPNLFSLGIGLYTQQAFILLEVRLGYNTEMLKITQHLHTVRSQQPSAVSIVERIAQPAGVHYNHCVSLSVCYQLESHGIF